MAIDMKTATGGGVTLFVLSGSSSYLIANSVSEGEVEEQKTPKDVVVSPKTETENELTPIGQGVASTSTTRTQSRESSTTSRTNSETAQSSKLQAGTTQTTSTNEPSESEEEITSDESEEIVVEEACLKALKESINDENRKKEAKVSCSRLTLEVRAKQLNISLLTTKGKVNKEALTTRFNFLKSKNPYGMATESAASIDWNSSGADDANIKAFCESVKKLNLGQISANEWKQTLDKEWSNFLMVCAQEENLNKDFWTGE